MNYLIDTSTLAEVLRATPPPTLIRRLSQVAPQHRWTSSITVSQLLVAARQDKDPRLMQQIVRLVSSIRVAPYDIRAAQSFAKYRATVASKCDAEDIMIAAIAACNDYTLVTRRLDTFARFPKLRFEDWI